MLFLRLRVRGFVRCRYSVVALVGLRQCGEAPLQTLRQRSRENNHILENPCIEWVGHCRIRQESRHRQCQPFIKKLHLVYRRPSIGSDERLGLLSKDSFHRAVMNVGVGSVQIRKRLLDPPADRFKQEPSVISAISACVENRKPEFKRHIEPRRWRRRSVQFHSRHIVNGVSAALDERNDAIQPSRAALKLQRSAGDQTEGANSTYIGKKGRSKQGVVGNVQENEVFRFTCRSFCGGRLCHWTVSNWIRLSRANSWTPIHGPIGSTCWHGLSRHREHPPNARV